MELLWQILINLSRAAARRELIRGKAAMLLAEEAKRKFQAGALTVLLALGTESQIDSHSFAW